MRVETRFNPGDCVWTVCANKAHQFRIAKIEVAARADNGRTYVTYIEERHILTRHNPVSIRHDGDNCFASKAELIAKMMEE